ncbi:hypothetical protein HYH02_003294 [Chlamydomonas schloesseri]|uniref:Uncharacterized protein n=1 Tax=Chlamydomonas schloesseri TaxID=2026947 RepID=A0A836BAM7_9CHLO|nr:hypothetical protein HYH02_003294 [Chlamydomonas schloesseri]|eukprot:KAG2452270.1 hypothetical protein HYH02_003294 [Chlamydomonas schloesseri]
MAAPLAVQPSVGLAALLQSTDSLAGTSGRESLAYVAVATAAAVASGPLATIAYRGGSRAALLGRAAATAAAPAVLYAWGPSKFTASALAPAVASPGAGAGFEPITRLDDAMYVLSYYRPLNVLKILLKNLGMHVLMKLNRYLGEYLEHEQEALAAETQGQDPPPPPAFPDLQPALDRGLAAFARELAVGTVRRLYERIALARLGYARAAALLRDSRAWIRDVLAPQLAAQKAALGTRFVKFQFATLHAIGLFWAADCTVAVTQHVVRVARRPDLVPGKKAALIARGVTLQVLRTGVILVTVSAGAAAGSLLRPGLGTTLGQLLPEIGVSVAMGYLVEALLGMPPDPAAAAAPAA